MKYGKMIGICLVSVFLIGCSGKSSNTIEDTVEIVESEAVANAGSDQLYVMAADTKLTYTTEDELYDENELYNIYTPANIYKVNGENVVKLFSLEENQSLELNVTLSGADSQGGDGPISGYQWKIIEKPEGSQAEILDANTQETVLKVDEPGDYVVELIVTDASTTSMPDQVKVSLKKPLFKGMKISTPDALVTLNVIQYQIDATGHMRYMRMEAAEISGYFVETNNTYNNEGYLLEQINTFADYQEKIYYTYNDKGLILTYDENDTSGWFEMKRYRYNNDGQLIEQNLTNGNFPDRVWQMLYSYDDRGNLVKIDRDTGSDEHWITTFEYNDLGQIIRGNRVNGSVDNNSTYVYDDQGRLLEKVTVWDNNGTISTYSYSYTYTDNEIVKYVESSTGYWERYTNRYDMFGTLVEQQEVYDDEEDNEFRQYLYELAP